MCTALTYKTKDFYFGRTLDYEFSYPSEVVVTPRNFRFDLRFEGSVENHYAIIGMAYVSRDYPLYFDAVNEFGLCMAGLNFVGNAVYGSPKDTADNIAQFELIPWILGRCRSVKEARALLKNINITDTPFSEELPVAELHWLVADRDESVTVEAVSTGVEVYDNPVGVLTNNPTFPEQLFGLNNYMHLSRKSPENLFSKTLELHEYSRGMGALGLPGDFSSQSRFVRAAFVKLNSVSGDTEQEDVSQFFHILGSVSQPLGSCQVADGKYEKTIYTSCCDTLRGIYYYTSYTNHQISAVCMNREEIEGEILARYPLILSEQIRMQN